MMSSELLDVRDLAVKRDGFRLEVDDWHLKPGEVVGLVGPNGAGKTTLLEVLAGLRPATLGRVSVFGRDPWRDPSVRAELGFMSDDMPLFTVRIAELLRILSGYYRTWDGELVTELLDRFQLDAKKKVTGLSKGQGTRLRLVVAMAFRPRVLLLDEPATGLDVAGRRSLLESVLDVVCDPSRSVIVSSHMLADVQRIADRLVVLDEGRVVRHGPTSELIGDNRTLEEALVAWGAA
jgi:ABC-2 type transport system ATP-binding protein